jgi:hypothetical protein
MSQDPALSRAGSRAGIRRHINATAGYYGANIVKSLKISKQNGCKRFQVLQHMTSSSSRLRHFEAVV